MVADRTKFGRHAMAKVAHLSQAAALYTNATPDSEWERLLTEAGATIRLA